MTQACFKSTVERERENLSNPEIILFIKKPQVDMQLRHKCHNLSRKKVFRPN